MGIPAAAQQQARVKARERRVALEHDRFARDQRVEAAAVLALVALCEREAACSQARAAEVRVGHALWAIIAEGVPSTGAASLCDLSAGEAGRQRRSARAANDCVGGAQVADPDPGGSPDAAMRALDGSGVRRLAAGSGPASPDQPGAVSGPDDTPVRSAVQPASTASGHDQRGGQWPVPDQGLAGREVEGGI